MPICTVCTKDRFLIYKRYQGKKLHPPRCIGCLVRFPIGATNLTDKQLKTYTRIKHKHHGWSLVKQGKKLDVWLCLYCKLVLVSPKLGVPTSEGCTKGSRYNLRRGFWASIKTNPKCPHCNREAELLQVTRIIKMRPGKNHFPFTCKRCFD